MERKTGETSGLDRSPRRRINPFNNKLIVVPSYVVDYVDVAATESTKFKISSLNNTYTGTKTYMGKKMSKRTNACLNKNSATDIVITWKN